MQKKVILSIVTTVLITSCAQTENLLYNPDNLAQIDFQEPTETIIGDKIKTNIYSPHEIECIDDFLIVLSDMPNAFVSIINCKSDSLIAQFGNLGRAKNEFIDSPKSIYWEKDVNGKIILYCQDLPKSVTKVIDFTESVKQNKCILINEIKHEHLGIDYQYFFFRKGESGNICRKFITYEDARDNIFYPPSILLNKDNRNTISLELYPKILSNNIVGVLYSAYFDILKTSPDKTKLLQMFNCVDLFNVIEVNNKIVNGYIGKNTYGFEHFQKLESIEDADEKMKIFYQDASVTDKLIIALKDGRTIKELKEGKENKFQIYIFNWDGEVLSSCYIDRSLSQIAYNESLNILYGFDHDGNFFKYNMTGIVK